MAARGYWTVHLAKDTHLERINAKRSLDDLFGFVL